MFRSDRTLWARLLAAAAFGTLLCHGQDSSCTVAYPNLAIAGNNGFIGTSHQVVIPQAAFTGCGQITEWSMLASCPGGHNSWNIVLQVWTPDTEGGITYHLRSSKLVTLMQTPGSALCSASSPITFNSLQNLTFREGDVPGMYVLPNTGSFLQPGYVRLDNDHQGALSDDIDRYLRVGRDSVVDEVTFSGADTVMGEVPLISLQVSGCSCTGEPGDPGNGNGNTDMSSSTPGDGSGNTQNGNGSTVDGGAVAAGVIVTLLVVAMVAGVVIVVILVWRRKKTSYYYTNGNVTSAKKTHTYTVPVARVYEEVGRVNAKKQLFEPTAYEVPVNVKETDMGTLYAEPIVHCGDHYWAPGYHEEEIYQQMVVHHYQEFDGDCVELTKKLGEGQFGEVYKAVLESPTGTSQDVAVKLVKKGAPQEERVKLLQEAAILGQFRHKHIVDLKGIVREEQAMLIMELLEGGDLLKYLRTVQQQSETKRSVIDTDLPKLLLKFCRQVAEGLSYLAGKSFVHRDIAARNILLDKELNCKISDFGMTRDLSEEEYYTMTQGKRIPIKWTAPESVFYKKYSTRSDVWSYGMLMYEIWSLGHKPFGDAQPRQVARLLEGCYCQPPPPGCPRAVYAIMVDCWHPDPHNRPAASSLCSSLNQPEPLLLFWDKSTPPPSPSAHILGAPLEEGHKLYEELQFVYQK